MFVGWRRERAIRRALRGISRQRVIVAVPGAPWVIERAERFDGIVEALLTARIRGWVDVIYENVPHGTLPADVGDLSKLNFSGETTIYRLTEAGWSALNRTHQGLLQ